MIEIKKVDTQYFGGCNGCSNRHIHRVYQVEIALSNNGMSFRLCERCKKELIEKLKSA